MLSLLPAARWTNLVESNSIELHCQECVSRPRARQRRDDAARRAPARPVNASLPPPCSCFSTAATSPRRSKPLPRQAGVAPATVYQAFGTKQAILAAALDTTIAGDNEPVAVLDRDWVIHARRQRNPKQQLRLIVAGACEIAARTAPIKEVMRDAGATEPAVRDLVREDHERRRRTQEALVRLLAEHRPLRPGMDVDHAVDTFFALVNSYTYELLVGYCGWTPAQWQDWLVDLLERELFG